MSQDVKVGLTGSGGDELFGCYGKWQTYERRCLGHNGGYIEKTKDAAKRLMAYLPGNWVGADQPMRNYMIFQSSYLEYLVAGSPVWHRLARLQNIVRIDEKDIVIVPVADMGKEK